MPWLLYAFGAFVAANLLGAFDDKKKTVTPQPSLPVARGGDKVLRWLPEVKAAHKAFQKIAVSLLLALIENESGGNPQATRYECKCEGRLFGGPKPCRPGCQRLDAKGRPVMSTGLVQFLIGTGELYGLRSTLDPATDERRDPQKNIKAAANFLTDLLVKFNGDENAAIAAYNAGEAGVKNYRRRHGGVGVPNPAYLRHIREKQAKYKGLDKVAT